MKCMTVVLIGSRLIYRGATVFELCVSLSVLWRKRSLKILNFYFMSFFSAVFSNRGPDGRSGEMKRCTAPARTRAGCGACKLEFRGLQFESESRLSLKTVKDSLK